MADVSTEGTRILTQLQRTFKSVRELGTMKDKDHCYFTLKYTEEAL